MNMNNVSLMNVRPAPEAAEQTRRIKCLGGGRRLNVNNDDGLKEKHGQYCDTGGSGVIANFFPGIFALSQDLGL